MLSVKFLAALAIGTIGWVGARFPAWMVKCQAPGEMVLLSEYFARGIFLATALLHLLPEAIVHAPKSMAPYASVAVIMLSLATAISLICIEILAHRLDHNTVNTHQAQTTWLVYFVLCLLSIHSLIAGAALGVSEHTTEVFIILTAIIAHKGAEAFAFGMTCVAHGLDHKHTKQLSLLFAIMTPLGVLLGTLLSNVFTHSPTLMFCLHAIGAGTFLYLCAFNHIEIPQNPSSFFNLKRITAFSGGIGLMTLLAFVFDL